MNKNIVRSAILVTGGALIGSATTFFIVKETLKAKYEAIADAEIESVREHYKIIRKLDELQTPEAAAEALIEKTEQEEYEDVVGDLGYSPNDEMIEELPEPVINNIFARGEGVTELIINQEEREFDIPYVISVEEFMDEEEDFDKITLSWYTKDKTLADERDQTVPDVEGTVGIKNLERFGVGSDSKDTVYVRNEKRKSDYEVCREELSFAQTVLGAQWDSPVERIPKKRSLSD